MLASLEPTTRMRLRTPASLENAKRIEDTLPPPDELVRKKQSIDIRLDADVVSGLCRRKSCFSLTESRQSVIAGRLSSANPPIEPFQTPRSAI